MPSSKLRAPGAGWRAGIAGLAKLRVLWRLRGSVPLAADMTNERAISRIAQLLEQHRKVVDKRGKDSICFEEPLSTALMRRNWRALDSYQSGRFWIEPDPEGRKLRYDLSSLSTIIIGIVGSIWGFALAREEGVSSALWFGLFIFLLLNGVIRLMALVRVPGVIRQALRPG